MTKIKNRLFEMATVRPHIQTFGLPIFKGTGPAPKQKAPEKGRSTMVDRPLVQGKYW